MNTNTKLNKISTSIALAAALLVASTQVTAEVSKESVLATAMDTCKTAAINRYGEKAVKSVESRVKWNKGLNGAEVKMKIRKKARSPKPFSCIVELDGSLAFYTL